MGRNESKTLRQVVYEGLVSLITVVMVTYMIFWLAKQANGEKLSLDYSAGGLFAAVFLAVSRESVETALFLSALSSQVSAEEALIGGTLVIVGALIISWFAYKTGLRLELRTFFRVTSIVRIIFVAAILRGGIQKLEVAGWLPPLIPAVWNTEQWLPANSVPGAFLDGFVGYTSHPSLLQLIGYVGYLSLALILLVRAKNRSAASTEAANRSGTFSEATSRGEVVC